MMMMMMMMILVKGLFFDSVMWIKRENVSFITIVKVKIKRAFEKGIAMESNALVL